MPRRRITQALEALSLPALALCLLVCCAPARAQSPAPAATPAEAPGSISGRVSYAGGERAGLAGLTVILLPGEFGPRWKAVGRAQTDAEGRYRFPSVAPGRYQLLAFAPSFVVEETSQGWPPGRPVTVSAGEEVEDFNFTVTPGGVITGRVSEADGRAVIDQPVVLHPLDPKVMARLVSMYRSGVTDDRGVYRLYGLPAGRYRVSVGQGGENSGRMGGAGRFYRLTFHPSATEESQAKVVEVAEGGEVEDVDIVLGKSGRFFTATGRVVYAATGRPAANVRLAYGLVERSAGQMVEFGSELFTNALGEFTVNGLLPGSRYGVFASPTARSDWYSDVATFEVAEADVSNLEVKLRRGATLAGAVVIEGAGDRAADARLLSSIQIYTDTHTPGAVNLPSFTPTVVNPDGTFLVKGLRPGRTYVYPALQMGGAGLMLVRVEQDGVERPEGVEVAEGAQVTGVRLVMAQGRAVVRGQLVVKDDGRPAALPDGAQVYATARRAGMQAWQRRPVGVDARGRFVLDAMPAGETEVIVICIWPSRQAHASQTVFVPDGGEVNVTITLDLSRSEALSNQ